MAHTSATRPTSSSVRRPPESINLSNVSKLWDSEGVPFFKYIVEGANLFLSPQARLQLEKKGVILYRNASANKDGVTSSSLEVLAGSAMNDEEFIELMTLKSCHVFRRFL
ncbi:hypothetical protein JCM8547_003925 [Rhodosporidiobolus lusitaniae]